jgi:hypothetical protein
VSSQHISVEIALRSRMYEERERERKRLRERERERERVSGDTVVAKMHVAQSRVKWFFFYNAVAPGLGATS